MAKRVTLDYPAPHAGYITKADANSIGQIAVARADWVRFEAGNLKAACKEYEKYKDPRFVTLHLDHIPVVEDGVRIDYESIIGEAIHQSDAGPCVQEGDSATKSFNRGLKVVGQAPGRDDVT